MLSALSFYRFANSLSRWHVPLLPKLLDYASRFLFACWFPHTIRAGKGVVLGYGGLCIVVHSDVELGNGVHIDQCVTIGGNGTQYGVPKIGNDVYIGAGAKILGPIMIGDGSVIGANAVVTKDIPPRSLAVGVPARIIRMDVDIDTFLYHKRVDAP